jgi:hypothetical protein
VQNLHYRWKMQPVAWIAIGLVLIAAAVAAALILTHRPDSRAYQDAVLVFLGGTAL